MLPISKSSDIFLCTKLLTNIKNNNTNNAKIQKAQDLKFSSHKNLKEPVNYDDFHVQISASNAIHFKKDGTF